MRRVPSKHAVPLVVGWRPIFGLCNVAQASATHRQLRAKSARGRLETPHLDSKMGLLIRSASHRFGLISRKLRLSVGRVVGLWREIAEVQ